MDCPASDPFRPKQITDMAGADAWSLLASTLTATNPPSYIVAGAAGCGKSCAIRLILGSSVAMWLRCSGDPNLRDSRERIKVVARRRIESGKIAWIVLEHADVLHADAQAFLRRILETAVGGTRFVLEVRDLAAIAEPLLSRCQLYNHMHQLIHFSYLHNHLYSRSMLYLVYCNN